MRNGLSILFALLIFSLGACKKEVDALEEQKKLDEKEIQDYIAQNNLQMQKTASGLYYAITETIDDASPDTTDRVFIQHVTQLLSGTVVDHTEENQPFQFPFGAGLVISGLEEGIALMHKGEKATFLIPSHLAYKSASTPFLPPYSVLRMDVELVDLKSQAQMIADYIAEKDYKDVQFVDTEVGDIQYIKLKDGDGDIPIVDTSQVTISYVGKTLNDKQFNSVNSFTFELSVQKSQIGWYWVELGLPLMHKGEKGVFMLPTILAYGLTGSKSLGIPPFEPILYEIEVLDVK